MNGLAGVTGEVAVDLALSGGLLKSLLALLEPADLSDDIDGERFLFGALEGESSG